MMWNTAGGIDSDSDYPRCLTSGTGLGTVSGLGTKWPQ